MTKEEATKLLMIYGEAWEKRDPELIVTIFTEDATYNDPKEPENVGREAIRTYWVSKVIGEQDDIHFHLRNVWVDGDTVIAEWDAEFTDTKRSLRIQMTEVAIFTVKDNKFSALREYYKTIKTPLG
jgi:ketosteroid isomerase-like protein